MENHKLSKLLEIIRAELQDQSVEDQVAFLNDLRKAIATLSPFEEPVDVVQWIPMHQIYSNS